MAAHLLILWILSYSLLVPISDASSGIETAGENTPLAVQAVLQTHALLHQGIEDADNNNNIPIDARLEFSSPFSRLNIVKRAPNGFTGMRGKKDYEPTDFSSNAIDWGINVMEHENVNNGEGVNDVADETNARRYKKTPTTSYLQKLQEERLRELVLQDFLDRIATNTAAQNEIAKRAPTGFTGMRGKRPADVYDMESEKRSHVNAFIGVRGKNGVNHQTFKRSPTESFNAVSKKQRFIDFGNNFVAVRGKKSSGSDSSSEISVESQEMNPRRQRYFVNMLPSLLFGSNGKRTPSGFLGMRGKRDADLSAKLCERVEDNVQNSQ